VAAQEECYHCHVVGHICIDCPALAQGAPAVRRSRPVTRPRSPTSGTQERSDAAAANAMLRNVGSLDALSASAAAAPSGGASADGGRGAPSDDGSDDDASADSAGANLSPVPAAAPRAPADGRAPLLGGAGSPDARVAGLPPAGRSTAPNVDAGAPNIGSAAGRSSLAAGGAGASKRKRSAAPIGRTTTIYYVGPYSFYFTLHGDTTDISICDREGDTCYGYLSQSMSSTSKYMRSTKDRALERISVLTLF
jgi:hypothetical protein